MTRQLENGTTRIVIGGSTDSPAEMTIEFRVVDGDLAEKPKRAKFEDTDFTSTVAELWQSAVSQTNSAEKIS